MNTSTITRISLNSLWLVLARVFAQALSIIFTALVARRFGETGLGQYAFIAAIIFLGNVFTTFGMDTLLIRDIARTRHPTTLLIPAALWIQTILTVAFVGAIFLFGNPLAWLYSLSLFPLVLYTIYSATLRAFERMDLYLLINLASSILQAVSAVIVTIAPFDLTTLVVLLAASQVITTIIAGTLCRRQVQDFHLDWKISCAALVTIVHAALPFALLTTLAIIYQRMGVFALATFAGDNVTGWFSAAARVIEATKLAPQAVLGALFPILARASGDSANQLVRASQTTTLIIGAVAFGVCVSFAQPIIGLIYGNRFEPSILALQILASSLIPYTFTANISLKFVARGREWLVLRGTVIAVAIAVTLFAILVPRFGLLGACGALVIAEWIQASLFWRLNHYDHT